MGNLRLIDADGHVREDLNEIQQYLEAPFNARKFFFPPWPGDGRYRSGRIQSTPAALWQQYMDAVGIEAAVLYPTLGLSHGFGCEARERTLPWVAQWLGADHIVFPTDFPHSLTFEQFVEEVRGFAERKDLPEDLTRKILWDNPKRLYRI
jgi:hypothetical protein